MKKPILAVMAAGMGSRYGKLKQLDPIGLHGEPIMEFSLYDALAAGFETVVFIIKHEFEDEFKAQLGDKAATKMQVRYAFQDVNALPEGYTVPEGRVKPWGTAHALLCAKDEIDAPFAVINADDFYGRGAFTAIFDYLSRKSNDKTMHFALVSYLLRNTLSEKGSVSRGVCSIDQSGFLEHVVEHTDILRQEDGGIISKSSGEEKLLEDDTPVSMNMWGFTEDLPAEIEKRFPAFLDNALKTDPVKSEFFLPYVVNELLREKKADVKVLSCNEKWYGITYIDDKPSVAGALAALTEEGKYPEPIF